VIEQRYVRTLKQFYDLVAETKPVRVQIVEAVATGQSPDAALVGALEAALASLRGIPQEDGGPVLDVGGGATIKVDLGYEIGELEKDLRFVAEGEEAFLASLSELHCHVCFADEVAATTEALSGIHFNALVTDRDGTIANYCGRYRSSVQPAWNAYFLSRFGRECTDHPVIITSAPLKDPGILDVSSCPSGTMIYGASKGREFVGLDDVRRSYPVPPEDQTLLEELFARLDAVVAEPGKERFGLIGSGLQRKFGQATIARQDITGSVAPEESDTFLAEIKALVRELDPVGDRLVIEDTGLDVEIILTIGDKGSAPKDFDKGDAVLYLDEQLGLDLQSGPHLVCGDTGGDVPLIEAVAGRCDDTWSVFVTANEDLRERVRGLHPRALFVSTPDALMATMANLSRK